MKWADDDELCLAVMEKSKLVVINGEVVENPILSSGYLAQFRYAILFNSLVKI